MSAEIVNTRIVHRGWVTLVVATVRHADGTEAEREIVEHGQAAAVLPYDPQRRSVMLVRLLRAPALYAAGRAELLEAPAGIVDEDDPAETVRREAFEEAGLRLEKLEPVATAWSSPGTSAERISLFLAPYSQADRAGEGGGIPGESENITVVEMPIADLWSRFEKGEVEDLKTLTLLFALRLRHPDLFDPA